MVAMDLEDMLSEAGHEVVGIAHDVSGVERLACLPSVALVDFNLRDGPTGRVIAERLIGRGGISVIFVTANPAQIESPPSGAVGYVQKPFTPQAILGAVSYVAGSEATPPAGLHLFDR